MVFNYLNKILNFIKDMTNIEINKMCNFVKNKQKHLKPFKIQVK